MKQVAIIGAGASGLPAIKSCLEEGLEPTCYEKSNQLGGLWNYTDSVEEDQPCVMKSTVINTSKEMLSYSDFPVPKDYAMYMKHTYVLKYLHLYAKQFDLAKYIRLRTKVQSVMMAKDFETTGRWDLTIEDLQSGEVTTKTYDAVMVCTGQHTYKYTPEFTGIENFQGKILHSHEYRDSRGYEDKKVIVVGVGNSGVDTAVDLCKTSKQVFLSTRRGCWVSKRITDKGLPNDMESYRRYLLVLQRGIPKSILEWGMIRKSNKQFDHKAYSLRPDHGFFSQHPTINDDLPNRIASGSIIVKPNIKRFLDNGVEFEDGTTEKDIDAVILATGYKYNFPFLDTSLIEVKGNRVDLYKHLFPPNLKHNTLVLVGIMQQIGAVFPISELQCRLSARVFKGDIQLPSRSEMWNDINQKRNVMNKRFVQSNRYTMKVDCVPYMDELAELHGSKPDLCRIAMSDPSLAFNCFFGPCTPYQFRLEGPCKWEGARPAILTQWDRTWHPMQTRPTGPYSWTESAETFLYTTVCLLMAYILILIF
ncbi:dimethylaniline monooxygenase [N-oxide-forming] 5-like [Pecten maximus]|uniref:dimethylaniline monooxygenase [N-oxide-forming] 5-like n=1 Tax=Pecten maximus TaxID=6579 RepID=UPI0014591950|nr:dimethylaniline monooxygenase [N-oxide-forming] 5-like [Pecten maximus]